MNLKRYYNQNRKKIWGIVIIIAFALLIFYLVNYIAKKIDEEDISNNNTNIFNDVNYSTNTSKVTTNQSVVTGEGVSGNQLRTATSTIDQFTRCI